MAFQSLTKADEMRYTELTMQPYSNWEQYLTPAPLSIAILGELVCISSSTDFPISNNPILDGSFHASLMLVCNSVQKAFSEAHKNMDRLWHRTMEVPDYMTATMKILFQGNMQIVKLDLPGQLERIRLLVDNCVDLAQSTEKIFLNVFEIIVELLWISLNDDLQRVEEQWRKVVRFFQMVSSIVKTSLTTTLLDFVKTSQKTQYFYCRSDLFTKDLLYLEVLQASNASNLIHMISSTYIDIYEKYLMDLLSSLSKIVSTDEEKCLQEHLKLQTSHVFAQKGILRLILKKKAKFEERTKERLTKIDEELLAFLPKAPTEEMKRIQEAVNSGFLNEELDDL